MTDILVPVALPLDSADYITTYGTATVYLEYGTATTPADGTATTTVVSGTEQYEFWVPGDTDYYYRWRVGDGSTYGPYSPVFQVPAAYATLQEVVRGIDLPDESRYDELETLLIDATDYISNVVCGGRRFFREPVGSGTTTLTLDVGYAGQDRLSLARGKELDVISITSVGIADYTGDSYTTMTVGTDVLLSPDKVATGESYTDLILSDQGSVHTTWPTGLRTVQLVGAFGWSAVPALVRRATVDLVRKWWNDRGRDGDPVGMSAFGSPVFGPGMPSSVRKLYASDYAWKDWVA